MSQVTLETIPKVQVEPIQTHSRRRIGLYGGTFNPVHNAHLMVADQVGHALRLNRVDFMPDAIPPHVDKKAAIDAKDRVAMLRLAIQGNSLFGLELAEIQRGGVSYTYDTIKQLKEAHPENDYYFIIGGDMVDYLPKWHRINELIKMVNFVAVRRPGAKNESDYPVIWVDVPEVQFSSNDIRQRIKMGTSIRYMVPDAVANYIEEHHLYHG
ncbi:nicotinate-nucleotide adenylyltransferase [Lactobacillus alvi]|uniref:Probable nicotinate-nucleotide adenylyltransferase n=1 Tax=Limosilactobacillus alvi TaxID=990412 RepID=A0ABS2ENE1_9LACO|nr:nicotinate-nucleotide adenylyltransferase [Limosilactobacillus alvi]MBM6753948.1 nicotinate-nucleotide adenylyltransferase [Limosilactobacillus alvi]